MLGRQPRLLEVLRPRLKACASLWLLLIHARQSRACGAERLRQADALAVQSSGVRPGVALAIP